MGVRSSQGCKEAVLENLASILFKKRRTVTRWSSSTTSGKPVIKSTTPSRKIIVFSGLLNSIRSQIIEMVALLKNLLSKGAKKEVGLV